MFAVLSPVIVVASPVVPNEESLPDTSNQFRNQGRKGVKGLKE